MKNFNCITCKLENSNFVCQGCSENCHKGHELIEAQKWYGECICERDYKCKLFDDEESECIFGDINQTKKIDVISEEMKNRYASDIPKEKNYILYGEKIESEENVNPFSFFFYLK